MKTVICNSVQSFWDMGDNNFLNGLDVHCVFPATDALKAYILEFQQRYHIRSISFSSAV